KRLEAIDTKKLAQRIAVAAKSKKAQKVVILDMRKVASFCDYFILCQGTSLRHTNAIAQGIAEDLAKDNLKPLSKVSPTDESGWVVLDFVSVIAHVFYKPMREFYGLERLWSDAKKVSLPRKS
ncbi:MAG: ribosome silencing factor, partial [Candidatus Omnitrophica bacterium]|nr:ribosome silencing factor [Candidatus Omnitrophota bacterium]